MEDIDDNLELCNANKLNESFYDFIAFDICQNDKYHVILETDNNIS